MSKPILSVLIFLFLASCMQDDTNVIIRKSVPDTDTLIPDYTRGCKHPEADNRDVKYKDEDGSCIFSLCANKASLDFSHKKWDKISKYINQHGRTNKITNKDRVKSSCQASGNFCYHPEADNYTPAPIDETLYKGEYCIFSACNRSNFDEYEKYLEFEEYLKTHPGEIRGVGTSNFCKSQQFLGCSDQNATNYDPKVNVEDKSCEFSHCADRRYAEFDQSKIDKAQRYIDLHGQLLANGKNRVTSTCAVGLNYCLHPDALEYRGPNANPADYLNEFCTFSACTKSNFDGYEKYLKYAEYLKSHPGKINADNSNASCQGQKIYGCAFTGADNYNSQVNIENGSCTFSYCTDKRYTEFNQAKINAAKPYLDKHGSSLSNGSSRITNTCATAKVYCLHPEAREFTSANIDTDDYLREFCTFSACTKSNFQGYSKYLEFNEYLKTHSGTILTDNSSASCLREIVTTSKKVDPKYTESKFEKAYIDFIIDDSFSMDDEIEQVKNALKEVTNLLIDTRKDLVLNFYKMSDMNRETQNIKDYYSVKSIRGNFTTYDVNFLNPYAAVDITSSSDIAQVKTRIEQILRDTKTAAVYGEQGMCLTLRHMNNLIKLRRSKKEQSIVVLLTDEDDNYKDDSKNCREEIMFWSGSQFAQESGDKFFEDNQGNQVQIQSFLDLINGAPSPDQFKAAYGWLGFIFDETNNNCQDLTGHESHGETYLEFARRLENEGIPSAIADICDESYAKVIEDKIINGFLEEVGYEYYLIDRVPDFKLLEVKVQLPNNSVVVVPSSEYVVVSRGGGKLHVGFTELAGEEYLKKAKHLIFDYTYTK